MRTIYIVFNNREKDSTCTTLFENLKFVFEDYINVKICFLSETRPEDIADGDLYLVLYKERVYQMKKYISSLDKVIVMSRTFERKYLDEVYALPPGTNVLVVNDSEESTIQTTNSLYELGLNHLNLLPYISGMSNDKHDDIQIAITPGEAASVPSFISRIIDVQNRCIDANTFIAIINKLDLNNQQITRNLLSYIQRTTGNTSKRYITDSIKDQLLQQTIQKSNDSIIITDAGFHIVHYNDKADLTFRLTDNGVLSLEQEFEAIFWKLFDTADYINRLIKFENTNYIVSKTTVRVLDQIIGYSLCFSTETDIKNLEIDLNKQLMKRGLIAKYSFDHILYKSDRMKKTVELAKKAALTDYTVLISGESGTGKELLAQSIHNFSKRSDAPFVAINCAALPESLLESELFGYEKGAFTGASPHGKVGLFEQANYGTIFLDEIGDMPLNLQARLLRVLQEKQITRIGSDKVISLDIRILAATNKNLPEAIRQKEFREDLYYRLSNIPLDMPPLRERKEDILLLFKCFTGNRYDTLTKEALHTLESYCWPGNIRELKNAADYFLTLSELPPALSVPECAAPNPDFLSEKNICSSTETLVETTAGFARLTEFGEDFRNAVLRNSQQIDEQVLGIIRMHTTESCGIGRTSIMNELRLKGIYLSDDKLRKIIRRLETEKKILVGKGRTGCMACSDGF